LSGLVWSGPDANLSALLTCQPRTAPKPSTDPVQIHPAYRFPPPVSALPPGVCAQQSRARQGLPVRLGWRQPRVCLHRLFPPIKAPSRHHFSPALWFSSLPCSAPLFPFPVPTPRRVCVLLLYIAFLFRFRVDLVPSRGEAKVLLLRLICVLGFCLPVPAQVPESRPPPFDAGSDSSLKELFGLGLVFLYKFRLVFVPILVFGGPLSMLAAGLNLVRLGKLSEHLLPREGKGDRSVSSDPTVPLVSSPGFRWFQAC
jgi:hypothetical protein